MTSAACASASGGRLGGWRPRLAAVGQRTTRIAALLLLLRVNAPAAAQDVATCPADLDETLTGLAGLVQDTADSFSIPGAAVFASWTGGDGQLRSLSVRTNSRGIYLLCGLPTAQTIAVHAEFAGLATEPANLMIEPGPPARWDIALSVVSELARHSRIVGRVTDRRSGRPLEGARITLVGASEGETLTDSGGRFAFADIDPGAYSVKFGHLGFEEVDHVIQVPSDRTMEVDFEVTVDAISLEPLVVTAVRDKRLELQGFYDRREIGESIGGGIFVTGEDLRRGSAYTVATYLGQLAGVETTCAGAGANNCVVRMTQRGDHCTPSAYLDGVRIMEGRGRNLVRGRAGGDSIDNYVSPSEVAGIEVYRGAGELPADFGGSVGGCGAIVIWTGRSNPG